jgi:hypothetical protein
MTNNSQIDLVNLIGEKRNVLDNLKHAEIKSFSSNFDEILKRQLVDLNNDESLLASLSREDPKWMIYDENRTIFEREENYYHNENISRGALEKEDSKKLTSEGFENNIFEKNTIIEEGEANLDKANTVEGVRDREIPVEDGEAPLGDRYLRYEDNTIARSTEDRVGREDLREFLKKMLSNVVLLNALLGNYGKSNEIHDIRASLKKLQESISNDKSNRKDINLRLESILLRLKSLLNKIEDIPHLQKNSKLFDTISSLKREILNVTKVLREYNGRNGRGDAISKAGIEPSDINNRINNKIFLTDNAANSKKQDNLDSRNDNSQLGFQFFRNNNSSYRNINSSASSNVHNRNAFNEQLQSIIQNARIFVKDSRNGSFSIRLYPESLGKVSINLGLEQGVLHGRFLVDSIESKNLLMENIATIREQLEDAGISLGEFQVNVRDNGERFINQTEDNIFNLKNSNSVNPLNEYDSISTYLHDGSIDMII